jgi:3-oxoacyl-[acyl-carrier protein] reductase
MRGLSMSERGEGVYVVTGGTGGLGRALCHGIARTGGHVVVADIGDAPMAFAKDLVAQGFGATGAGCNVASRDEVASLRAGLKELDLSVDVVINLAGATRNAPLDKVTEEDFDFTLATHARGTLNMMWAFAPAMKDQRYGRIVNTSSVAALGSPTGTSYVAAKGAIEAMTRTAAIELARYGITVNCVAPGGVDGGMFRMQPEKAQDHMISRTPMRRVADPAEIAACYRFLSSREASFVTGQILYACGGASIGAFL